MSNPLTIGATLDQLEQRLRDLERKLAVVGDRLDRLEGRLEELKDKVAETASVLRKSAPPVHDAIGTSLPLNVAYRARLKGQS